MKHFSELCLTFSPLGRQRGKGEKQNTSVPSGLLMFWPTDIVWSLCFPFPSQIQCCCPTFPSKYTPVINQNTLQMNDPCFPPSVAARPALQPGIRYTGQAYYNGTRVAAGSFTADASLLPIGFAGAADL